LRITRDVAGSLALTWLQGTFLEAKSVAGPWELDERDFAQ
jgi:hypothetical protein